MESGAEPNRHLSRSSDKMTLTNLGPSPRPVKAIFPMVLQKSIKDHPLHTVTQGRFFGNHR